MRLKAYTRRLQMVRVRHYRKYSFSPGMRLQCYAKNRIETVNTSHKKTATGWGALVNEEGGEK